MCFCLRFQLKNLRHLRLSVNAVNVRLHRSCLASLMIQHNSARRSRRHLHFLHSVAISFRNRSTHRLMAFQRHCRDLFHKNQSAKRITLIGPKSPTSANGVYLNELSTKKKQKQFQRVSTSVCWIWRCVRFVIIFGLNALTSAALWKYLILNLIQIFIFGLDIRICCCFAFSYFLRFISYII